MKTPIRLLFALLCAAIASLQNVHARTLSVFTTQDHGIGSLREAIRDARSGDTITFEVRGFIYISSQLEISQSITISGPGARYLGVAVFFPRLDSGRIFFVSGARAVTISGLTISGGRALEPDDNAPPGAGIYNDGNLTVNDCVFADNVATRGGGIFNGGTLTVNNSTIIDNRADLGGGGILNYGNLTVSNSTISGNRAGIGGGIENARGTLTVNNSTISGNSAEIGGGIENARRITVNNSTISDNSGVGIFNKANLEIGNTILRQGQNIDSQNIDNTGDGIVTSLGYNMCSDSGSGVLTGPGDRINTDPMLGPLWDNGGPTLTQALLPGSPAINAGNPSFTPPPEYDQRGPGYRRVQERYIDIGAFEVQMR